MNEQYNKFKKSSKASKNKSEKFMSFYLNSKRQSAAREASDAESKGPAPGTASLPKRRALVQKCRQLLPEEVPEGVDSVLSCELRAQQKLLGPCDAEPGSAPAPLDKQGLFAFISHLKKYKKSLRELISNLDQGKGRADSQSTATSTPRSWPTTASCSTTRASSTSRCPRPRRRPRARAAKALSWWGSPPRRRTS